MLGQSCAVSTPAEFRALARGKLSSERKPRSCARVPTNIFAPEIAQLLAQVRTAASAKTTKEVVVSGTVTPVHFEFRITLISVASARPRRQRMAGFHQAVGRGLSAMHLHSSEHEHEATAPRGNFSKPASGSKTSPHCLVKTRHSLTPW